MKHILDHAKYPALPVMGVISRTPFSSFENNICSGCRCGNLKRMSYEASGMYKGAIITTFVFRAPCMYLVRVVTQLDILPAEQNGSAF